LAQCGLVVAGYDDDLRVRMSGLDSPGSGDPIDLIELDIHQHPIRPVGLVSRECHCAVMTFADLFRQAD